MSEKKEKLSPVVNKSEVTKQKKSFGKKLVSTFVQSSKEEVIDYLVQDVLIPGAKDALLDTMEMIFFHDKRGRSRSKDSHRDYTSSYKKKSSRRSRSDRDDDRDRDTDYRDIVLTDREAAYEILDQLQYRIQETGAASIADLLDLVNLPTKPSDNDWGWDRKGDISVRRVNNGWLIDVPRARYIE